MNRIIDETFLTVHPRTALWWQEREQCAICKHSHSEGDLTHGRRTSKTPVTDPGMRCSGTIVQTHGRGRRIDAFCIDAREEGQRCGPNATLFISIHRKAA